MKVDPPPPPFVILRGTSKVAAPILYQKEEIWQGTFQFGLNLQILLNLTSNSEILGYLCSFP